MARSKLHKRYRRRKYRRNPDSTGGARPNPPLAQDIFEWIGPGFAGFVATRFLTRVVGVQIGKRKPSLGKHAAAAASAAVFAASWFLANRWKAIAKYQMPLIVGSGLATAQTLLQIYLPKLGWMVADASPEIATAAKKKLQNGIRPEDLRVIDDDPDEYVYNDQYDAGRSDAAQTSADQTGGGTRPEDDLADLDLDEIGQTQNMGIFGTN